jgi:23S rRNA pseudouridine2457 synthase
MTIKNKIWYFALNKPYGVLSQFSDQSNRKTLKGLFNFPKGVYPVGRLDMDSEGLLILTNDKKLTGHLLSPKHHHEKEYYVQVENIPSESVLNNLRDGAVVEEKITLPAKVKLIKPPNFVERIPPIRNRENIPTAWLSMIITEGRNRQVRKMTAKIGHPTLRLIRVRIKNILIGKLKPGEVRELSEKEIRELYT